ncbi:IS630-Spn1%2C transposase Orf2 [Streptococcus pneumoniae]|nr:IS630-Spn1%2C transposase Orf2 [Streptococcus pneumoniae]
MNGELIAPMTYEEMMTSDFFEAWFQKFLLPTLTTPSVIIMDNARFHRMGKLELLCEEFGHKLLPLPPYSSKLWATLEKKNHTYYEQDPEKVALFLKNFNSLKHLSPV